MYNGKPLKNVGFQIYKGATPHLTKIHVSIINQYRLNVKISLKVEIFIKYKNMYSIKYQSKVSSLKYKNKININKFKDETREIQNKYSIDCSKG